MRNLVTFSCLLLLPSHCGSRERRVTLLPQLHAGQEISYLVRYHSDKTIKTTSRVIAPMAPEGDATDFRVLVRIIVLDAASPGRKEWMRGRAVFSDFDSLALGTIVSNKLPAGIDSSQNSDERRPSPHNNSSASNGDEDKNSANGDQKTLEFTMLANGRVGQLEGFDKLTTEQQLAWHEWAMQFALAATFPAQGIAPGSKWRYEQPEESPSAIAGLAWLKEANYVKDETCHAVRLEAKGEIIDDVSDMCAEILVRAKLKQNSPAKDATPDDYKRHDLRTSGTAHGTNEVISSISLRTGLVLRASQEANQSMDVQIIKADGSNGVHYLVDAHSRSEIFLVKQAGPTSH